MSKQFEELSKDLAAGMSRRKAFWRFGAGMGAVMLGLIGRKKVSADDGIGAYCSALCAANDNLGCRNHGQCVSNCVQGIFLNGCSIG